MFLYKGDVGMTLYEIIEKGKNMPTPRQKVVHNPK